MQEFEVDGGNEMQDKYVLNCPFCCCDDFSTIYSFKKECALIGREIYDIVNDMAEVLNASQLQRLQANQNFSKIARLVDELGSVVILKNNAPRYLVIDFSKADDSAVAKDDAV